MPVYLHQPGSAVVVPLQGWRGPPRDAGSRAGQDRARGLPGLRAGRHARWLQGDVGPRAELGACQVQIGTPASLTAGFTHPRVIRRRL